MLATDCSLGASEFLSTVYAALYAGALDSLATWTPNSSCFPSIVSFTYECVTIIQGQTSEAKSQSNTTLPPYLGSLAQLTKVPNHVPRNGRFSTFSITSIPSRFPAFPSIVVLHPTDWLIRFRRKTATSLTRSIRSLAATKTLRPLTSPGSPGPLTANWSMPHGDIEGGVDGDDIVAHLSALSEIKESLRQIGVRDSYFDELIGQKVCEAFYTEPAACL